ncbi:MAG: Type 1 glutamine amidotransferase-like domain-containing protein [Clostridia bacterium]|nr:Type 1 glutamine amidotransferase-like domain-containing protein [Clostridia bacterium]
MIVLTSNGLSNEKLLDEIKKLSLSGKAALVVTADNEYKEKNYHVERLTSELQSLGLTVECFDFDTQSPKELIAFDVVELIGGNPYYLLNSILTNGFIDVLRDFADNKCIIGCSAGAVVLTPTLRLIDIFTPEMNIVNLNNFSACNLTDVQIFPHYNKFIKRFDKLEEKVSNYEKANNCNVVRLNDGEAVIVNNNSINLTYASLREGGGPR